jgi:hypothetical protein
MIDMSVVIDANTMRGKSAGTSAVPCQDERTKSNEGLLLESAQ